MATPVALFTGSVEFTVGFTTKGVRALSSVFLQPTINTINSIKMIENTFFSFILIYINLFPF